MKKIKGVLFDLDGTLCDSQSFIYQSFCVTLTAHNLPVPSWEEFLEICRGMALVEAYQAIAKQKDVEHLCKAHRAFQNENEHNVGLFPNVQETLLQIQHRGIRMAIVTNRGDAIDKTLEHRNIARFFETVRNIKNTADRLQKPHPQMLLDALRHMDIDPSSAIMVGDMREDIEAGKAAKVNMVVGVTYGFTGPRIAEHNPHHVIDDIQEILDLL